MHGTTHTLITHDGPEVAELRAFLQGTLPGLAIDERVELWFENGATAAGSAIAELYLAAPDSLP